MHSSSFNVGRRAKKIPEALKTRWRCLPYRRCVGVLLLNADGLIWIGRRIPKAHDPVGEHVWQMPQGGIDAGEEPEQAARRELHEETGTENAEVIAATAGWLTYDLPEHLIGVALKGRYRGQCQKWFAMRFLGKDEDFCLEPEGGHKQEFDVWRWAPLSEAPGLIVPFKRAVYEEVVRSFAPLARPAQAA